MEASAVIILIISLIWSILGIILFFKVWRMTNHVSDIRSILQKMEESKMIDKNISKVEEDKSKPFFNVAILKKGEIYPVKGCGLCTYHGVWDKKYSFYPVDKEVFIQSPASKFLVNDIEPYLLIPKSELGVLIS